MEQTELIVCRDVSLGYEGQTVLSHLDLTIRCGDYLCVVGDNGSMALGGAIAAMAIFSRSVLLLAIMGACFVASSVSCILQVGSYKLRKKRIFKMAPLHHHFELLGYTETRIVSVYMIITTLLCLLCLLAYV